MISTLLASIVLFSTAHATPVVKTAAGGSRTTATRVASYWKLELNAPRGLRIQPTKVRPYYADDYESGLRLDGYYADLHIWMPGRAKDLDYDSGGQFSGPDLVAKTTVATWRIELRELRLSRYRGDKRVFTSMRNSIDELGRRWMIDRVILHGRGGGTITLY